MARKVLIQVRRGLEKDIGTLSLGELGFTTDTEKLYIGTANGNVLLVAAQTVGDMLKSIYDTNNDGIVDRATTADSVEWTKVLGKPTNLETTTGSQSKASAAQNAAVNYANAMTGLRIIDNRAVIPKPSDYAPNRTANEFKSSTAVGLGGIAGTYVHVFSERAWTDPSGGYVHQLAYDGLTTRIWTRYGNQSTDVWGAWSELETTTGSQKKIDDTLSKGFTWGQLRGGT